jgi:hypothetical protein
LEPAPRHLLLADDALVATVIRGTNSIILE